MSQEDLDHQLANASYEGELSKVKSLLEQGAKIDVNENTPLRWASSNGHLDVVKYLLSKGADIHASLGDSLLSARRWGHTEVVKYLESVILKEKRLECLKKI